jgi:hypothetical protein
MKNLAALFSAAAALLVAPGAHATAHVYVVTDNRDVYAVADATRALGTPLPAHLGGCEAGVGAAPAPPPP